jgi:hypothetical protein
MAEVACSAELSVTSSTESRGCDHQTQPQADARRVQRKAAEGRAAPGLRPRGAAVRPNGARRCPGPWRASQRQETLACEVATAVSKPRDGMGSVHLGNSLLERINPS